MLRMLSLVVLVAGLGLGTADPAGAGGEGVTGGIVGQDAAASSGGGIIIPLILLAVIAAAVAAD